MPIGAASGVVDQRDHGGLNRSFRFKDQAFALGLAVLSLAACSPKAPESPPIRNPAGLAENAYPPSGWTTGLIPAPPPVAAPRRYGVASAARAPKADVLVLPEREPAEAWFPVVNALVANDYTVWLADPQPAPLDPDAVGVLRRQVMRGGSSGRLVILAQGRGAVAALAEARGALAVVLWSPVAGSLPYSTPAWERRLMQGLGQGGRPLLGQPGWREGEPAGDPLAQAWMKANPSLRPKPPTYDALLAFERRIQPFVPPGPAQEPALPRVDLLRPTATFWISGGDAAARGACAAKPVCKPIAPGIEAMIATFDEATRDLTRGAPPPPPGRKRASVPPSRRATAT